MTGLWALSWLIVFVGINNCAAENDGSTKTTEAKVTCCHGLTQKEGENKQPEDDEIFLALRTLTDKDLPILDSKRVKTIVLAFSVLPEGYLARIKGVRGLEHLDLQRTRTPTNDDLKWISEISTIKTLKISGTKVTDDGLKYVKNCTHLRELDVSELEITGSGFAHLQGMQHLEFLEMCDTKLVDSSMEIVASFQKLKHLGVGFTKVTNAGMKHIGRIASLESVDVSGNDITEDGLMALKKLRSVNMLRANYLKLKDLQFVRDMDSLQELELLGAEFTNDAMRNLRGLQNLRKLNLGQSNLTDAGLADIAQIPRLRSLWLSDTSVSRAAVEEFQKRRPTVFVYR